MDSSEIRQLKILAAKARMGAILGTYHAKSGHPGGSLSAADIFTYLYFKEMNVKPEESRLGGQGPLCALKGSLLPEPCTRLLALKGYFDWDELTVLQSRGRNASGPPRYERHSRH